MAAMYLGQQDCVLLEVDMADRAAMKGGPCPQLALPGPDEGFRPGHSEGDEQQAGLVHVLVVGVYDDDLGRSPVELSAQTVRQQRPSRASAQHDDSLCHFLSVGQPGSIGLEAIVPPGRAGRPAVGTPSPGGSRLARAAMSRHWPGRRL
jgi:hypothetical protein